MDIKEKKREIRNHISTAKKELSLEQKVVLSKQIFEHVEQLQQFKDADTIMLYHALKDEVQTQFFLDKWYKKKRIVLPVVQGNELLLRQYIPEDISMGYQSILEPQNSPIVSSSEIEFAIIPGVAFDCNGNRLGRGKGFYDRFLESIKSLVVGVGFELQIVQQLPIESFDKPLDAIVTEKGMRYYKD